MMALDVGMAEGAGLILDAVIAASMVIHTSRRSAFDLHALLRRPAGRVFPIRSVSVFDLNVDDFGPVLNAAKPGKTVVKAVPAIGRTASSAYSGSP